MEGKPLLSEGEAWWQMEKCSAGSDLSSVPHSAPPPKWPQWPWARQQRLGPTDGYPRLQHPHRPLQEAPVPSGQTRPTSLLPSKLHIVHLWSLSGRICYPVLRSLVSLLWIFTSSVPPTVVQGLIPVLILLALSKPSGFSVSPWLAGVLSLLNLLSFYSLI